METNDDDLENHPLIRLMMRSVQMIPAQNEDILQTTFDQQEIKSIPTCNKFLDNLQEMYITKEDVENRLACSICQEEFQLDDKVIELPCNPHKHYFHIKNKNCDGVLPWLSTNNTCPMCRCEFPKAEVQENSDNNNSDNDNNDSSNNDSNNDEPSLQQSPLPSIDEIILQAINRRNNINIVTSSSNETNMLPNIIFPNISVDTVRDGFSDRDVDEAIRRSLES